MYSPGIRAAFYAEHMIFLDYFNKIIDFNRKLYGALEDSPMHSQEKITSHCRRAAFPMMLPFVKKQGMSSDQQGFTLIELLVVMLILGVLVTIGVPSYNQLVNKAKIGRCVGDIYAMQKDITAFSIDKGLLPAGLITINRDNLRDPWGNPYEYSPVAVRGDGSGALINEDFDLYSKGQDGVTELNIDVLDPTSTPLSLDDILRVRNGGSIETGGNFALTSDGY